MFRSYKSWTTKRSFRRFKMWFDKFVLCTFVFAWAGAQQDVQLEIPQGFLKGLKANTVFQNMPYYSFKGIPYAKPNVGLDKFQVSRSPNVLCKLNLHLREQVQVELAPIIKRADISSLNLFFQDARTGRSLGKHIRRDLSSFVLSLLLYDKTRYDRRRRLSIS